MFTWRGSLLFKLVAGPPFGVPDVCKGLLALRDAAKDLSQEAADFSSIGPNTYRYRLCVR